MSIFSRLFQKEGEEGGAETPLAAEADGGSRPHAGSSSRPAPAAAAALGGSDDKTTPMLVIEASPVPPPPPRRSASGGRRAPADVTTPGTSSPAPDPVPSRSASGAPRSRSPSRATERPVAGNDARPTREASAAAREPPPLPAPRRSSSQLAAPDGAVDEALDRLFPTEPGAKPATPRDGVSTALDQQAVRATFEDLAAGHMRPLRNMMIELRFCDSLAGWPDLARAAMRSLRKMAEPLEMKELCRALDGFAATLDAETGPGVQVAQARERLMTAYQPLVTALPRAFALDGECDRREPLLVPALLRQVPGLEPLMIRRLAAVGLGRLETLMRASPEEIEVVAAIPAPVAAALASKMQELRAAGEAGAVGLDSPTARRALEAELRTLADACQAFESAAAAWSAESRAAKARHRRERELAFLRIVVALARAGEVDLARKLEVLPSARRIEELSRCLREAAASPQI